MSQENVEIVRGAIDAMNRGDWDAALKAAAPNFEFDLSRAVGPLHGGRVISTDAYKTKREALEAAGLSE